MYLFNWTFLVLLQHYEKYIFLGSPCAFMSCLGEGSFIRLYKGTQDSDIPFSTSHGYHLHVSWIWGSHLGTIIEACLKTTSQFRRWQRGKMEQMSVLIMSLSYRIHQPWKLLVCILLAIKNINIPIFKITFFGFSNTNNRQHPKGSLKNHVCHKF